MPMELSNFEKFTLLTWKNIHIQLRYKELLATVLIPPAFFTVLVFLRFLLDAKFSAVKSYRATHPNGTWNRLLVDIENRRKTIIKDDPSFKHNVYVPQLVLAFAPNSAIVGEMIQIAVSESISGLKLKPFDNCSRLRDSMEAENYFAGICVTFMNLEFTDMPNIELKMVFPSELRINNDSYIGASWSTNLLYDAFNSFELRQAQPHYGGYVGYVREGFAAIQSAVALAFIKIKTGQTHDLRLRRFPYHEKLDDSLSRHIKGTISLVMVCAFLYPVLVMTNHVVIEKKNNVKHIMKIYGVGKCTHVFAWFVKFFVLLSISSALIVILLKISWKNGQGILPQSSGFALYICLIAYSTVAISYCLMMAAIFSETETVIPVAGIVWLFTYIPYLATSLNSFDENEFDIIMCCFCNTALGQLFSQIIEMERLGKGLQLNSFFDYIPLDQNMTKGGYILILYFLSFLYIIVAIVVEDIRIEKTTIIRKWNLFFQPKEISRNSTRLRSNVSLRETIVFEIEKANKNVVIKVENLCKEYKNGESAVKNLNVNFYEGDVTALVGHNACGKTTLLKLLGGFISKTSGQIVIEGLSVDKYKTEARKNVSIFLNEDFLFPSMNAIDHLRFYARLRGINSTEVNEEVQKYLKVMQIGKRKSKIAFQLSQSEQRLLGICCTFVGNSKIILLDEPSKGFDIIKMKCLWELIIQESKARTIILASHNEEETEAVADRIGFLSGGELKCFGSGFFLKKVFGQGQRLICYKGEGFQKNNLTALMQSHIPNISVESETGRQVSYILDNIATIPDLFNDLENKKEELGVVGISTSEMNMQDLFFRIETLQPTFSDHSEVSDIRSGLHRSSKRIPDIYLQQASLFMTTGFHLFLNQCEVMFYKRLISSMRRYVATLLALISPLLITIISLYILNLEQEREQLTEMTYNLYQYPRSKTTFHLQSRQPDDRSVALINAYEEELFLLGINHVTEKVPDNESSLTNYLLQHELDFDDMVNIEYLIGFSVSENFVTAYFNNFPLHTVPLTLNMAFNAMLRANNYSGRFMTTFEPLPFSSKTSVMLTNIPSSIGIYLPFLLSACVAFTSPLGVIYLVRERKQHFKFFQHYCGVKKWLFWLNCLTYDTIFIIITTLIIELIVSLFNIQMFEQENVSGSYFLILVFAGMCMCPANYLMSLIRDNPQRAYAEIAVFNIIGTMSFWAYLEVYRQGFKKLDEAESFENIMRFLPHFSLCSALMEIFNIIEQEKLCSDITTSTYSRVIDHCKTTPNCCERFKILSIENGVLLDLFFICGYGVLCWILVFILENVKGCRSFWNKKKNYRPSERQVMLDEDFIKAFERGKSDKTLTQINEEYVQEVLKIDPSTDKNKVLVCKNLSLKSGKKQILDEVTFAVSRGEICTIIGENRSGKSVLEQILIGYYTNFHGTVHIDGLDVQKDLHKIYPKIGFVTKNEFFLSEYTLYETMRMICLLKGVPNFDIINICENISQKLGFNSYLPKRINNCSGGIKRRFYFACALIGNPQLILFHEGMAGVDIRGQRQWHIMLSELCANGRSIIKVATSAEGLENRDRALYLSEGRILLSENPWSICQNLANGYYLKMKIKKVIVEVPVENEKNSVDKYKRVAVNPFIKLANFIENQFPMFHVKDRQGNIVEYFIPKNITSMAEIYKIMQRNAFNLYLEHFTISNNTLSMFFSEVMESQRQIQAKRDN